MKVNFQITEGYALNFNGRHIDLHNNLDFTTLEYNIVNMSLTIRWIKSSGDWVEEDEIPGLALVHRNVSYLQVLPRDPEMELTEDSCLRDITYFPSSERNINNSVTLQKLPGKDNDVLYIFQSGQVVRIHCEEIELMLE